MASHAIFFWCKKMQDMEELLAYLIKHKVNLELTAEKCKGLNNLYLSTSRGQIDCLGRIKGLGE